MVASRAGDSDLAEQLSGWVSRRGAQGSYWFTNRKLGLVFETRVVGGRLLVCSVDLRTGLDHNLVARQMRHSLLDYAAGPRFKPTVELTAEQVRGLMEPGTAR